MMRVYGYLAGAAVSFSLILGAELDLGSDIPMGDVEMMDVSGERVSLQEAMGPNGLLVIFSCNTCPWVKAWEDRYLSIADAYLPKGIGMIAINSNEAFRRRGDSLKDMKGQAEEMGYDFYYTLDRDSRLARAFGATRTPHVFLFNPQGELVYRGAIDDNARNANKVKQPYLSNAIDQMLSGKPVSVTSTKALGCTIKFAAE
ncbi:MAG: thioredoxin family protein [Fidelibacterota bacterium]